MGTTHVAPCTGQTVLREEDNQREVVGSCDPVCYRIIDYHPPARPLGLRKRSRGGGIRIHDLFVPNYPTSAFE